MITIRRATAADLEPVSALIAAAFSDLAVTHWLIPDDAAREPVLAANFRIHVEHALTHGIVDVAGGAAVAVWFPPSVPEPADYDARLAAGCAAFAPRFRLLDAAFEAHHPKERHHHLAFLATHPSQQGSGLGTELIRHHHTWLDGHEMPAYLEASSERARDLYLREGYEAEEPFHLPEGPPLWPMWRKPAPPSNA
ncbi:GNAT family N-acetyltransferase [Actinophytocola sp.]|uniref:GNAT family N-acetyltransferase n=1 Tax=Actinophytocola sp. TaxID=1872138 RepID=UPI002ED8D66D